MGEKCLRKESEEKQPKNNKKHFQTRFNGATGSFIIIIWVIIHLNFFIRLLDLNETVEIDRRDVLNSTTVSVLYVILTFSFFILLFCLRSEKFILIHNMSWIFLFFFFYFGKNLLSSYRYRSNNEEKKRKEKELSICTRIFGMWN